MLVKYDYSKDGIITAEEALLRVCNSDLIDSLQHMYEMDGDMLISTYNNLIRTMHTLRTMKESDFKPVRNPRWLWGTKYGKFYDPLVWVKADGKVHHSGASIDTSKPSSGLSSL